MFSSIYMIEMGSENMREKYGSRNIGKQQAYHRG
jgi:hypothetical protein